VGSRARIISDPDTEVLDLERAFLVDLIILLESWEYTDNYCTHSVQADNLSVCLLDFSQLHKEVPETRFGNHGVGRKDSHPIQLWCWVCLGWQMAANDLVFCETT
jgi:hypothetical protein